MLPVAQTYIGMAIANTMGILHATNETLSMSFVVIVSAATPMFMFVLVFMLVATIVPVLMTALAAFIHMFARLCRFSGELFILKRIPIN